MDLTDEILSRTLRMGMEDVRRLSNSAVGEYTQLHMIKGNWWLLKIDDTIRYHQRDRKYYGFYVCEQISELKAYCVLKGIEPKRI